MNWFVKKGNWKFNPDAVMASNNKLIPCYNFKLNEAMNRRIIILASMVLFLFSCEDKVDEPLIFDSENHLDEGISELVKGFKMLNNRKFGNV